MYKASNRKYVIVIWITCTRLTPSFSILEFATIQSFDQTLVTSDVADFNLLWSGLHPKPQTLRSLAPHQRVNHFPRSYELTRKDRLYKNIEKMQHCKGFKHFDFIPSTFVMPGDFRELTISHYRTRGPWIVKPVASSRGRGIYIVDTPDEVPLEESVVVAKYIEKPLLVEGHKCDLRLYVVVTSYDPLIIYMYEEGLVRFATVKYDSGRKHLWNPCMHLCNYSINKHHSDYIKSEDPEAEDVGHKWTLSALLRHLRSCNVDTGSLMQRIEDAVIKAVLATAPSIIAACKLFVPHFSNCFELYGFDILIDSDLKPWLLEVNLSPSLGCDTPLDTRLKSAMLADTLTLVGIPALDPMLRHNSTKRSPFLSSSHTQNGRRVHSADSLPGARGKRSSSRPPSSPLSPDEARIVKWARAQFERRGGFIRIFPSRESWKRYSCYLDPATGIPTTGNMQAINMYSAHNYNLLLHQVLFPRPLPSRPLPSVISAEKLSRYERALGRGHRVSLEGTSSSDPTTPEDNLPATMDTNVLKQEVLKCFEDGLKLSQTQARCAFGTYLQSILKRLSAPGVNRDKPLDERHSELVLRFLQKACHHLKSPYQLKVPSKNLTGKDRVAVIAKQLSDFLFAYNKETDACVNIESGDMVPSRLFGLFLNVASENDIEEVLTVNTQMFNCSQVFFGQCGPSAYKMNMYGLLQSIGK
ncbi:hypothetical protein M8J75_007078 [Diaphorina citri]|nr:hypothetical protein M8J75_007078 [Diaphorina citri]